jgi:hypothetical protein
MDLRVERRDVVSRLGVADPADDDMSAGGAISVRVCVRVRVRVRVRVARGCVFVRAQLLRPPPSPPCKVSCTALTPRIRAWGSQACQTQRHVASNPGQRDTTGVETSGTRQKLLTGVECCADALS